MDLHLFTPEDFASNTYLIEDEGRILCIDPSCPEAHTLLASSKEVTLIATHGHFDHILHADTWAREFHTVLYVHSLDIPLVQDPSQNLSAYFGPTLITVPHPAPLDTLSLEAWQAEIWHLPGHSPGSIGIYFPARGWFFGGDLLFASSVGRTDLPGGDETALWQSVTTALTLPDETMVYPGHGDPFPLGDFRQRYTSWRKP